MASLSPPPPQIQYLLLLIIPKRQKGELLSLFQFEPFLNCPAVNVLVRIFWWTYVHIPRNGIVGSRGIHVCSLSRNYQRGSQSGCMNLHVSQQGIKIQLFTT